MRAKSLTINISPHERALEDIQPCTMNHKAFSNTPNER
jgi:hypothetical protein